MINALLAKVIGTQNERELKRLRPIVARVNELESGIKALSDLDLKNKTTQLRERVAAGESLDDVLPEAFAVVREAGWRVLKMRHFDVQLLGGMVLTPAGSPK
jgi:preprotein translocase subunit SecA